ncbi:TPA: hypothetical protein ACTYB9_001180 [Klebsiella michiganensis]
MKKIIYFLVTLVLLFATLDGLRDTFFPDNPISYIKELAAITLFILLLMLMIRKKANISKGMIIGFNIFLLFLLFVSFATTKYADTTIIRAGLGFGGWSVWIKLLALYCLINSLYFLSILYPDIYYKIPKRYANFTMIYCIITLFFILTGLASNLNSRNWAGRLSIGYPTMDSFVLIAAIIFTIFFIKNKKQKTIYNIVFIVVLIMQNTATGYIMLAGLGGLMMLSLKGTYKTIPVFLGAIAIYVGYLVYDSLWMYMGRFGILFVDKINGFIFGADTSSIDLRQTQITILLKDMESYYLYVLFGKGGNEAYLVESTYYAFYGFCGLIGLALFVFSLLLFLGKLPKSFKTKTYYCHSFYIATLFVISSAGLIGFYLYPLIFIYSYLVSVYCSKEFEHIQRINFLNEKV